MRRRRKSAFVLYDEAHVRPSTGVRLVQSMADVSVLCVLLEQENNSPMELALIWEATETQATEIQWLKYK